MKANDFPRKQFLNLQTFITLKFIQEEIKKLTAIWV